MSLFLRLQTKERKAGEIMLTQQIYILIQSLRAVMFFHCSLYSKIRLKMKQS